VSVPPVEVYEAGLRAAQRGRTEGWRVRYADGGTADLPLGTWTGGLRPGDRGLLDRCAGLRRTRVRLEPPAGPASAWFPWAQVGSDALSGPGTAAGLGVAARWVDRGRWFAVLAPARSGAAAKAAMPSAKPIRADQPSSSRARAEDAVTCRTSPSR